MTRRLLGALMISLLFVGISFGDMLDPEAFRQSDYDGSAAAKFLLSTYNNRGFEDTVELAVIPKTSGKYAYSLIDTRDNYVLRSGEETYNGPRDNYLDVQLRIDLPGPGRSITYRVGAVYEPYDKINWDTVLFDEYFTVSNNGGRITIR